MGGSQLHKAFEGASHRVSLNVFGSNKVLAVDVSILVHKWVFSNNEAAYRFVRFDEMDQLVSLFREVVNWLLTANTTYIMVFDGVCPGKADLNRNRAAAARVARKRMMELLGQDEARAGSFPVGRCFCSRCWCSAVVGSNMWQAGCVAFQSAISRACL